MAALLSAAAAWLTILQPGLRPPWIEMEGTCPTYTGVRFSVSVCADLFQIGHERYQLALKVSISSAQALRERPVARLMWMLH